MRVPSLIESLPKHISEPFGVDIRVKRDDLIHPVISGNKYRKLVYNLTSFRASDFDQIITFGGAHSNHIDAVAFLCHKEGIPCSAIIRGEEPSNYSPTLKHAAEHGMKLHFVSRTEYRQRNENSYLSKLQQQYPSAYIIPEGGANDLGVKGCEEIVKECQQEVDFDYITVDCGTGATLAGMVRPLKSHQKAIGIQVLKGVDFISKEVESLNPSGSFNYQVWTDYHFGGYAKYQSELISFMRWFHQETGIQLDPVYTGKQFYAVFDQLKKGFFPKGSSIVLTHTGGLQGIQGFEERYGIKIY